MASEADGHYYCPHHEVTSEIKEKSFKTARVVIREALIHREDCPCRNIDFPNRCCDKSHLLDHPVDSRGHRIHLPESQIKVPTGPSHRFEVKEDSAA